MVQFHDANLDKSHFMFSFREDRLPAAGRQNGSTPIETPSLLLRTAVRISRAKWFSFLRRVFHYQNGSRSDLGSNPFNSGSWIALEFLVLVLQIFFISFNLAISKDKKSVWPVMVWMLGYGLACVLNLPLLYWRYLYTQVSTQESIDEESRSSCLMNKWRTCLELFYATWFSIGIVWFFGSPAPKVQILYTSLLAWNGISYSFPFILFLLFCCLVPTVSSYTGYNMSLGALDRGATGDEISTLLSWRYKANHANLELGDVDCNSEIENESSKCCICLAQYRDSEELRQLPCSHMFHLKCVDKWLKIIACCPLCKQELER